MLSLPHSVYFILSIFLKLYCEFIRFESSNSSLNLLPWCCICYLWSPFTDVFLRTSRMNSSLHRWCVWMDRKTSSSAARVQTSPSPLRRSALKRCSLKGNWVYFNLTPPFRWLHNKMTIPAMIVPISFRYLESGFILVPLCSVLLQFKVDD